MSQSKSIDHDLIEQLPLISLQLNRIVPIIQIILGTFGNALNIAIFTRRSLRTNSCSFYFLASSFNNIFVLYVATLTRLLSSGWHIDPSNNNVVLCKLRSFFVYSSLALIQWFVVLASIDRYLSSCTNPRYRRMSTLSVAKVTVGLTIVLIGVAHSHTFIWWTVDVVGQRNYCNIFIYEYELFFQISFLLTTCIIPPFLMALFGILTILNIRKLNTRSGSLRISKKQHFRLKDRKLIIMLLIQVFVTVLCTLPFAVANITLMIFQYFIKLSAYGNAINAFFGDICRLINYFNPVVGFYIYTLSSRLFRNEMICVCNEVGEFIGTKLRLQRYVSIKSQNSIRLSERRKMDQQCFDKSGIRSQDCIRLVPIV